MYEILERRDNYSEAYMRFVDSLPEPYQPTEDDMLFVAVQVPKNLMKWAYNQKDEQGTEMHEYAKIIGAELENASADFKNSKLYQG